MMGMRRFSRVPARCRVESARVRAMQAWLRLLIVSCIAIALPVQGIAGVTMAHCGPSDERTGSDQAVSHHQHSADRSAAAHQHDAAMAERADLADSADQADPVDQVDDTTAAQAQAQLGKWSDLGQCKCSSCTSCCAGSALQSAMPRIAAPACAPAVFAEAVVAIDAFASDGPDRPPRTHLA